MDPQCLLVIQVALLAMNACYNVMASPSRTKHTACRVVAFTEVCTKRSGRLYPAQQVCRWDGNLKSCQKRIYMPMLKL